MNRDVGALFRLAQPGKLLAHALPVSSRPNCDSVIHELWAMQVHHDDA